MLQKLQCGWPTMASCNVQAPPPPPKPQGGAGGATVVDGGEDRGAVPDCSRLQIMPSGIVASCGNAASARGPWMPLASDAPGRLLDSDSPAGAGGLSVATTTHFSLLKPTVVPWPDRTWGEI